MHQKNTLIHQYYLIVFTLNLDLLEDTDLYQQINGITQQDKYFMIGKIKDKK